MGIGKIFKKIWEKWKKIARVFAKINFNIIMTLFYFLIIGPVSLVRKTHRTLSPKPVKESYWLDKKESGIANFKNQF